MSSNWAFTRFEVTLSCIADSQWRASTLMLYKQSYAPVHMLRRAIAAAGWYWFHDQGSALPRGLYSSDVGTFAVLLDSHLRFDI